MPFSRGEFVRHELVRYFVRRHEGDLDPRPSMLERAHHPKRKLPKPPRPAHPLCPERVTLEAHLAGLMSGMWSGRIYPGGPLSGDTCLAAFPGVTAADRRRLRRRKWRPSCSPCTPRCCGSGRSTPRTRYCIDKGRRGRPCPSRGESKPRSCTNLGGLRVACRGSSAVGHESADLAVFLIETERKRGRGSFFILAASSSPF